MEDCTKNTIHGWRPESLFAPDCFHVQYYTNELETKGLIIEAHIADKEEYVMEDLFVTVAQINRLKGSTTQLLMSSAIFRSIK